MNLPIRCQWLTTGLAIICTSWLAGSSQAQPLAAPQITPPSISPQTERLPAPSTLRPTDVEAVRPQRPSLGIVAEEQPQTKNGLVVITVRENSPSARAGVRVGDVLTSLNGKATKSIEDVTAALGSLNVGDAVVMEIQRGGQLYELRANMSDQPPPSVDSSPVDVPSLPTSPSTAHGSLGLSVVDANSTGALPVQRGAKVSSVEPGSPAAQAGVKTGDIIVSVDGKVMYGARELIDFMKSTRPGQSIQLGYYQNRVLMRSPITLGGLGTVPAPLDVPQPRIIGRTGVGEILQGVGKTLDNFLGPRGSAIPRPGNQPGAASGTLPTPAQSDPAAEVLQLRQQVEQLLQRIEKLEGQLQSSGAPTTPQGSL